MLSITQSQLDGIFDKLSKESPDHIYDVLRHVGKNSLYIFASRILGYKDMTLATHGPICEMLQSEGTRKMVCVPRSCFKSSLVSIAYPLWRLVNDPNLRILIDSELYRNSKAFLREIKQHIEGEKFKAIFGDIRGDTWTESEIVISTRTKILKEASISVGGIGTQKTGMHFDAVCFDDLNSENNTRNSEQAEKVIEHYRYAYSLLEPWGTVVIAGTRYASNDVLGHILQHECDVEIEDVAY